MALIKLSAIGITTISGKTDGQIFANSGRGRYVKNFTVPTNPQTAAQQAVRATFAALSQAWRQLTEAQQIAWNEAAPGFPIINRVGDVIILSGQMLFQQLNLNLSIIGIPTIDNPPAQVGAQEIAPASITPDTTSGELQLTMDQNINAANKLIVQATAGLSAGVFNANSLFKQITVLDSADLDPVAFTIQLSAQYEAVFGVLPAVGTKVFLQTVPMNLTTGERGTPSKVSALAT